jgi:hypothetical protein
MSRDPQERLPGWMNFVALIGLPGFLLMFLLGAIPGLPSPYMRQGELVLEQQRTIQLRDRAIFASNYQMLRAVQQACRGVWQNNPQEQAQCLREWPADPRLNIPTPTP